MKRTRNQAGIGSAVLLLALLLILAIGAVSLYVWRKNTSKPTAQNSITNFDECVAAGNPVMDSYPEQCSANGQTYVKEKVSIDPATYDLSKSIINPEKAPDSLKRYLLAQAREGVDDCVKTFGKMYSPPTWTVHDVVESSFASVNFASCNDEAGAHYVMLALQDGSWKLVAAGQSVPACNKLEDYEVPASLKLGDGKVDSCVDEAGKSVSYPRS